MRVVLQRVSYASVKVDNTIVGEIGKGLLVLVGFEESDNEEDFEWISNKVIHLRVFPDTNGVMNLSIKDISGEFLIVSQFTLLASTKKGNRPSYIRASSPQIAKNQYKTFVGILENLYFSKVQKGIFGADMKVELLNDGPVTICMDSKNKE